MPVMDGNLMVEQASPIFEALENAIWAFARVRRRYPLLVDTAAELDRVRAHFKPPTHNDGLMQVMRDSFDMLVIDLFSIRESLVERGGLLNLVRDRPEYLRRRTPDEFKPPSITIVGVSDEARERFLPEAQRQAQQRYARDINKAIERLVGPSDPVTAADVVAWIARFRAETEALDSDRNRVRAHRYQRGSKDTNHLFIPLSDLAAQIAAVQHLLSDLYLIFHNGTFSLEMSFECDPVGTAESLADLLVHGTINRATLAYGVVPEQASTHDREPWYWAKREAVMPRTIPKRETHHVPGQPHNLPLPPDSAPRRR